MRLYMSSVVAGGVVAPSAPLAIVAPFVDCVEELAASELVVVAFAGCPRLILLVGDRSALI